MCNSAFAPTIDRRRLDDWEPVVRALWVCALYVSIPIFAGYLVFLRRDVAGE